MNKGMFWCFRRNSLKFYQFAFWTRKLFCILQVKDIQQTFGHHTSLCSYVSISFLAHLSLRPKWALSVVLRRWRRRCRKLFIFSSSSQEPLGQSQPTRHNASLGDEDSSLFKWRVPPFIKGRSSPMGLLLISILFPFWFIDGELDTTTMDPTLISQIQDNQQLGEWGWSLLV